MIFLQKICLFFTLLLPISFSAIGQITEDFSDGDFTTNPTWTSSNQSGSEVDFQITTGQLQSNGPSAPATLWISTPFDVDLNAGTTTWHFKAQYGNAPSGSNNIRVYLLSNQFDLTAATAGYYIQLGESGSGDGIHLYKTGSSTPIIEDSDSTISGGINVNIKVTRTAAGEWTLEGDPTGGDSFSLIGTAIDTEFSSGTSFGFVVNHTSTRNQDFYFDDINVAFIDNSPPALQAIEALSDSALDVTFSENVEQASAETLANYTLNNGFGNPFTAVLDGSNKQLVHLTFDNPLVNGTTYQLNVQNIQDTQGNTLTTQHMSFFYFEKQQAVFKDVIINEIMADPSPPNDLPDVEFVELYNNSSKPFDLEQWVFADAALSTILTQKYLLPEGYLILCPEGNVNDFTAYGDVLGLPSWPSLNNTGNQLVLKDDSGNLIDTVAYSNDWYGDEQKSDGGWSLELIDPGNSCGGQANWIASPAPEGATPGAQNAAYNDHFDTNAPEIISAVALSDQNIAITFDERIDTTSLNIADFSVESLGVENMEITTTMSVSITLNTPLTPNTNYSIVVKNVGDCSGNLIDNASVNVIFVEGDVPNFKDVVINEVLADPTPPNDLPEEEFIEVFNRSDKIFDLQQWTLADASTISVLGKQSLFPGDYVILCPKESVLKFNKYGSVMGLKNWPSLNNGGDQLVLKDSTGVIIDTLAYSDNWYGSSSKREGGWSLELIDPNNECGEEENWSASQSGSGGTPGKQNSIFSQNPDLTGPQLAQAFAFSPDSLVLTFNEKLDIEGVGAAAFQITPNLGELIAMPSIDKRRIVLMPSKPILAGIKYQVTVSNVLDCSGNIVDNDHNTLEFSLIEPAEAHDIAINEILFNPRSGGVDFVEIYNNSSKYLDLGGWQIANGEETQDSLVLDTEYTVADQHVVLEPSQFLVFTEDGLVLQEQYPLSKGDRFLELSNLPSYPNSEGLVAILNDKYKVLDYFSYSEDLHSALLDNVEGISLERISIDRPTNQRDNWKSAAESVGFATPGYQNSQSYEGAGSMIGQITIDPKVIVPDGSGRQDYTTISYAFKKTGNVGTVRIFDLQGRLIKEIANNYFLGGDGFFTWDGTTEQGRKAKIGYYLVLFEMFDAEGNTKTFKKKVVVGSRF